MSPSGRISLLVTVEGRGWPAASGRRGPSGSERSPQVRQTTRASAPCSSVDVPGAGGLVQPVDVLGDDRAEVPASLERGHGLVAGVGTGEVEPLPADVGSGPSTAAGPRRSRRTRRTAWADPPVAVGAAVVGDAGLGGDAGAREGEHVAARRLEELGELVEVGADGAGSDGGGAHRHRVLRREESIAAAHGLPAGGTARPAWWSVGLWLLWLRGLFGLLRPGVIEPRTR